MLKDLLNERQRREIIKYLQELPNEMPLYIRGLKNQFKKMDFAQMKSDLELMEHLTALELPVGRKKTNWRDLPGFATIRQQASAALPAELTVKHPEKKGPHSWSGRVRHPER